MHSSMCFTSQFPVEATVDFTGGFPEGYTGPGYGALKGLNTDLYAEMKRALEERPGVLITTCSLIHKYRWNLASKSNGALKDFCQAPGDCWRSCLHSDGTVGVGGEVVKVASPCQDPESLGQLLRVEGRP